MSADCGEAESAEQAVSIMNQLLQNQVRSVAPKYQDVIRESAEFGSDEIEDNEDSEEEEDYQSLKEKVVKMLVRKIDAKMLEKVYKGCNNTSK